MGTFNRNNKFFHEIEPTIAKLYQEHILEYSKTHKLLLQTSFVSVSKVFFYIRVFRFESFL